MNLENERQVANTRRKLAGLEELIANKIALPPAERLPGYEVSIRSSERFAEKLRREIAEYEAAAVPHQAEV